MHATRCVLRRPSKSGSGTQAVVTGGGLLHSALAPQAHICGHSRTMPPVVFLLLSCPSSLCCGVVAPCACVHDRSQCVSHGCTTAPDTCPTFSTHAQQHTQTPATPPPAWRLARSPLLRAYPHTTTASHFLSSPSALPTHHTLSEARPFQMLDKRKREDAGEARKSHVCTA